MRGIMRSDLLAQAAVPVAVLACLALLGTQPVINGYRPRAAVAACRSLVRQGRPVEHLTMRDTDLRGLDLSGAVFRGVNLRNANLEGARPRGTAWRGCDLRGARPEGASYT